MVGGFLARFTFSLFLSFFVFWGGGGGVVGIWDDGGLSR